MPASRRRLAVERALRNLAPRIPAHELGVVLDHAEDSPGLRVAAPETAAWLSMVAYVRHVFTEYDALRAEGYDEESARHFVAEEMNAVLGGWGVRRTVGSEDLPYPAGAEPSTGTPGES
jgi:hypothetical protein